MSLNLSKTILTFSVSMLLVAASLTPSDARSHAKRQAPTQSEPSSYNQERGGDSSCFSRATGLPTEYACSANGG
jgi:hypothetical protein